MKMNKTIVREFIKNVEWVWAKSYADTFPHYYTTRDRVGDDELFNAVLQYMREKGEIKSFFKFEHIYYGIDGWEYWEMGRPIKATVVLNRVEIAEGQVHRMRQPLPGAKERLLKKLNDREAYIEKLLSVPEEERTDIVKKHLERLLSSKTGCQKTMPNIIDHSDQEENLF